MPQDIRIHNDCLAVWRDAVTQFQKTPAKDKQPADITAKIIHRSMEDVRRLWDIFTQERDHLGRYLSDPKRERSAYLIGFHLANVARMQLLAERTITRYPELLSILQNAAQVVVHDLGCGTGAQSHGFFGAARKHGISTANWLWRLLDKQKAYLEAAGFMTQRLVNAAHVQAIRTTIDDLRLAPQNSESIESMDVIILGNVWNELSRQARARQRLLANLQLFAAANRPALLLVVEPANQHIARNVMKLRDELFHGGWRPIYPCPAAMPCPMLERSRDWCFSEGMWKLPKEAQLVDRLLGTDRTHLSGSMYAFVNSNSAIWQKIDAAKTNWQVLVGKPRITNQKRNAPKEIELLICSKNGLSKKKPAQDDYNLLRGETLTHR